MYRRTFKYRGKWASDLAEKDWLVLDNERYEIVQDPIQVTETTWKMYIRRLTAPGTPPEDAHEFTAYEFEIYTVVNWKY